MANDTSDGLAAGFFTNYYERAMKFSAALQAGTLGSISTMFCIGGCRSVATRRLASDENVVRQLWRLTQRSRLSCTI